MSSRLKRTCFFFCDLKKIAAPWANIYGYENKKNIFQSFMMDRPVGGRNKINEGNKHLALPVY